MVPCPEPPLTPSPLTPCPSPQDTLKVCLYPNIMMFHPPIISFSFSKGCTATSDGILASHLWLLQVIEFLVSQVTCHPFRKVTVPQSNSSVKYSKVTVGGWLFVAGAAHRDILGESRSAKFCILQYKIVSKIGPGMSGARWRFHARIMVGWSSNRLSIGGSTSGSFRWNLELQDFVAGAVFGEVGGCLLLLRAHCKWRFILCDADPWWMMRFILRGRRSICWVWRVTLLAPHIRNDVSYVTQITHDIVFVWQAQYSVRLEGDFSWQAQHIVTFWEIAGARNVVIFNTKSSPRSDQ